jgi:hypothetical protein
MSTPLHAPKTPAEVDTARRLLDEAGFEHWFVVETPGHGPDPNYLRAERTAGGKVEVQHTSPHVLVQLVREVENRLPSKPTVVADGMADSTNY